MHSPLPAYRFLAQKVAETFSMLVDPSQPLRFDPASSSDDDDDTIKPASKDLVSGDAPAGMRQRRILGSLQVRHFVLAACRNQCQI